MHRLLSKFLVASLRDMEERVNGIMVVCDRRRGVDAIRALKGIRWYCQNANGRCNSGGGVLREKKL